HTLDRSTSLALATPPRVITLFPYTALFRSPLAGLPLIGRMLRLPAVPQPGAPLAVRVAEPTRGAVIRMVVSPARPEAGILQLAGGQSGHPLADAFADQWPAWHSGSPAPFLAGETVSTVTLRPADAGEDHSNVTRSIDGGS